MQALIFRFFDICILRAGPQDLPSSLFLLRLIVVLGVVVGTIMYLPMKGFSQSLAISLFGAVFLTAFLYIGLKLRNKLARFRQTVIAAMGTGIILDFVMMPFEYTRLAAQLDGESSPIAFQMVLLTLFWSITVFAHIIRHSFEIRFGYGFIVSVGYVVLFLMLANLVFTV